jgi:HEAT repeats
MTMPMPRRFQRLLDIGLEAVPALLEAIQARDPYIRSWAAFTLGMRRPEPVGAVPTLIKVMQDDIHELVVARAAYALGQIGQEARSAVPALIDALRDNRPSIRPDVTWALGKMGPDAIPALASALRDDNRNVRTGAVRALRQLGPDAGPTLVTALQHEDDDIRTEALKGLENIGPAGLLILGEARRKPSAETTWDLEAYAMLKSLKLFYLVFRVYMEGERSFRKASTVLQRHCFKSLQMEKLAKNNVSFSNRTRQLEPFFTKLLGKESLKLLVRPQSGGELHFTDDAQKAWEWTDSFLRQRLPPDWFGFYRLSPEI